MAGIRWRGFTALLFFMLSAGGAYATEDCISWGRVDAANFKFLPNGSVLDLDGNAQYPLGSYWTEGTEESGVVHHCLCRRKDPCLRKCCGRDEAMDYESGECVPHDHPWPWFRPIVASDFAGNLGRAGDDHFRLIFGKNCQGTILTHPRDGYGFYVNFTDGTLNLLDRGGLGPGEFCLDFVPELGAYLPFLCLQPLESGRNGPEEKCRPWERREVQDAVFSSYGSVWDADAGLMYPLGAHWTEGANGSLATYGCPCGLDKPCLRKCCRVDEAMDFQGIRCVPFAETRGKTNGRSVSYDNLGWFRPNVTSDIDGEVTTAAADHFALIYGNFCWGYLLEPKVYPEDEFYLNFTDGTLSIVKEHKHGLGPDEFCLEYYPEVNEYLPYKCFKKIGAIDPPKKAPGVCYKVRYTLYPACFTVSIFFLVISLVVYLILPDLRNVHGKCLMCHMISALLAYSCLASVQTFGVNFSDHLCTAIGFIIYFSILCTFFWLNIMCIDIYMTFSGKKVVTGNDQERDKKKFHRYVMYAWGLPLIILAITLFMEFFPHLPDWALRPEFKKTCWFQEQSKMAYYSAPVGIILACNTVLFVLTAINILRISRETRMLKEGDSKRHNQKEDQSRFYLHIKLSVVMGVSWVMEIISVLSGGSECIWIFTDLMNILQGLFIFLIFVCKRNVKDMLVKKLCPSLAAKGKRATSSTSSDSRTTTATLQTSVPSTTNPRGNTAKTPHESFQVEDFTAGDMVVNDALGTSQTPSHLKF